MKEMPFQGGLTVTCVGLIGNYLMNLYPIAKGTLNHHPTMVGDIVYISI